MRCTLRVFVSLTCSFPSSLWLSWALPVTLPCKTILDMRRFRLKNWQFDENRVSRSPSAGTHTEAQRRGFSEECWIGGREGKDGKWKRKPFSNPVLSHRKSQWRKRLPPQNSPMVHPNTTSTQFHVQYPAGIFGILFYGEQKSGLPREKGREGTIISTHICCNLVQALWRVAQKGAENGGEKAGNC